MTIDTTRRGFLAGAAALAVRPSANAANEAAGDLKLGVASYSLRKLSRAQAIEAIKAIHTPYVNIKEFHNLYKGTPEERAAARREFEAAGLKIAGGGTISLQKDDDADIRFYFDYAKQCGMPLMVIAPTAATLPRIEKFAKEYNIKVAVHNHGPEDKHFPTPQSEL